MGRLAAALACLLTGCAGTAPPAATTPPPKAPAAATHCPAVRAETEPSLLLADDARAALALAQARGAVAVRYEAQGCEVQLEVTKDCAVRGTRYDYRPYVARETRVAEDAQALFQRFPLGAKPAALRLSSGALRSDSLVVGLNALSMKKRVLREQLKGSGCARATHVVTRIDVGGYDLVTSTSGKLSAMESRFESGGSVASQITDQGVERLRMEGSPAHCAEAISGGQPAALCSVPLRLGLQALELSHGEAGRDAFVEAELERIDARLRGEHDCDTGHQRFRGTVSEVLSAYRSAALDAKAWSDELEFLLSTEPGPRWVTAVRARQASLYDSIARGLRETKPPDLRLFTPEQQATAREKLSLAWEDARRRELAEADQVAVTRYAQALVSAKQSPSPPPEARLQIVRVAIERLAQLTSALGDAVIQSYLEDHVPSLAYSEGLFIRLRDSGAKGLP